MPPAHARHSSSEYMLAQVLPELAAYRQIGDVVINLIPAPPSRQHTKGGVKIV